MHYHFDFSLNQILWTITFAAELVLLVVLMGRDRLRRFPWFNGYIIIMGLLLLITRMLFGKMPPLTTTTIFLALSDVTAIIGLMVVVEVCRHAFAGASRRAWLIGTLALLVIGGVAVGLWGQWPAWNTFAGGAVMFTLRSMQLLSDKLGLLDSLLDIEMGILIVILGRRFHGGWRSHPQQIAIGLAVASISQLSVRLIWQSIATKVIVHSQAEYEHVLDLRDRIYTANNVVFFLAIVWWIAWLWLEEPGSVATPVPVPELPAGPSSPEE